MMSDKTKALMHIQTVGFAIDEAVLFLDTHPTSADALAYYHNAVAEYNKAVEDYVTKYGPLNATQVKSHKSWSWVEGCMPWEEECNVEI